MTALRRTLSALWLSLALAVLAVVGLSHVVPALGYRLIVIAGGSMSPGIPIGSVVIERDVASEPVSVGSVVTMTMPNGAMITHRVVRIGEANGEAYVEIRGDANRTSDPTVVPLTAVTGVVAFNLPMVGFLLAFLAVPTGVLSIVLTLAAIMFAIWTLEELDAVRVRQPGTAPEMADGLTA
jgi:signal peptidase I